ncbi:MAG: hypothetical protein HC828_09115 [Blastochloris sp.]|nr:hypothetical protein [Blastochloris sp.]
MAWRIQLPERNIRRLDILTGRPTVLAAWVAPTRVVFLDLQSGTRRGEQTIPAPPDRDSEKWPTFLEGLKAPNGVALPVVRMPGLVLQATADGEMRLYQARDGLSLDVSGKAKPIVVDESIRFLAVGIDRLLGLIAALDTTMRLHIYQQHLRIGIFETGLSPLDDRQPELIVSHSGTTIFASDSQRIVQIDATGRIRQRLELHYALGSLCCTPDGRMVATVDADSNVIRIYSSGTLKPTHQRFAVDCSRMPNEHRSPRGQSPMHPSTRSRSTTRACWRSAWAGSCA